MSNFINRSAVTSGGFITNKERPTKIDTSTTYSSVSMFPGMNGYPLQNWIRTNGGPDISTTTFPPYEYFQWLWNVNEKTNKTQWVFSGAKPDSSGSYNNSFITSAYRNTTTSNKYDQEYNYYQQGIRAGLLPYSSMSLEHCLQLVGHFAYPVIEIFPFFKKDAICVGVNSTLEVDMFADIPYKMCWAKSTRSGNHFTRPDLDPEGDPALITLFEGLCIRIKYFNSTGVHFKFIDIPKYNLGPNYDEYTYVPVSYCVIDNDHTFSLMPMVYLPFEVELPIGELLNDFDFEYLPPMTNIPENIKLGQNYVYSPNILCFLGINTIPDKYAINYLVNINGATQPNTTYYKYGWYSDNPGRIRINWVKPDDTSGTSSFYFSQSTTSLTYRSESNIFPWNITTLTKLPIRSKTIKDLEGEYQVGYTVMQFNVNNIANPNVPTNPEISWIDTNGTVFGNMITPAHCYPTYVYMDKIWFQQLTIRYTGYDNMSVIAPGKQYLDHFPTYPDINQDALLSSHMITNPPLNTSYEYLPTY